MSEGDYCHKKSKHSCLLSKRHYCDVKRKHYCHVKKIHHGFVVEWHQGEGDLHCQGWVYIILDELRIRDQGSGIRDQG